jgi:hypothetical protein
MIHNLDDCTITPRIQQSWLLYIPTAISQLQSEFKNLRPSEIPDEQLKEKDDGSAEIFVTIRGRKLKINIPSSEWAKKTRE